MALTEEVRNAALTFLLYLPPFSIRKIRSFRHFFSQRSQGPQIPSQEEDFISRMERDFFSDGGTYQESNLFRNNKCYLQPSRANADFSLEIFDWNQIEQSKSLGSANIDLNHIEPFVAAEQLLHLLSEKHGEKGQIRVRMLFQPEIIVKARKNTSTFPGTASFSTAGRAMTQFGALPVTAGKGVFQGVTGVFKKEREADVVANLPPPSVAEPPQPFGTDPDSRTTAFPSPRPSTQGDLQVQGTLKVTVLDARDLPVGESKAYASIRVGDKEHKTKHGGKTATPEW